ncbi:hypothetical protein BGZ54_008583 [Gamsiella multidivaricata]|nr:hypothetical protein BGZ54_008583 [Gamsiella multidivaricata]
MGSTDSGHTSFASSRQQRGSIKSRLHTSQSPQSPISAPLTLLDITVTPDHTTLVATLCERSHEGREGVYCWDFNGSRLQGYHEQGAEMSTMIIDKYDIDYEEGEHGGSNDEILDQEISQNDEDETDEWSGDSGCEGRFNNNMVMQQVDASVFRNMHQARITGKVWIGWRLDENEFRRLKVAYRRRTLERRRRRKEMGIESLTDASLVRPDIADSMVHVSLR